MTLLKAKFVRLVEDALKYLVDAIYLDSCCARAIYVNGRRVYLYLADYATIGSDNAAVWLNDSELILARHALKVSILWVVK